MNIIVVLEGLAVLLAIAYLLLAIRQNIWCWLAAICSSAIYCYLFFLGKLYMESALQIFYIAMAVYGWALWRVPRGGQPAAVAVHRWPLVFHVVPIVLILLLTLASGALLAQLTSAASPYLDSFTTWGALVATWMVARKILENWHYWFLIDAVSIYLFISRDYQLTALLFAGYLVLIVLGYQTWRRDLVTT